MRVIMNILGYLLGALVIAAGIAALMIGGLGKGGPASPAGVAGRICPPTVSLPPRAPGAPPDEVAGVRLGFNAGDMEAVLLCLDEKYAFRSEAVWHTLSPEGARTEKQIIYAELGMDRLSAGLAGPSGAEVIVALWRETRYPAAEGPLKTVLEQELVQRYGAPHITEDTTLRRMLSWAYDPQGAPLKAETKDGDLVKQLSNWVSGTLLAPTCVRQLRMSALEKPAFNAVCGITIRAEIEGAIDDPTKASSVKLALLNQKAAADAVAQYRASHP